MLAAQSPLSGHQSTPPPKSGRKPLQPKNALNTPITPSEKPKPKQDPEWIKISLDDNSNKENIAPSNYATHIKAECFPVESFDASLAEELSAIREKVERLRIDKQKTEKKLRERDLILDMKMEEIVQRGEVQRELEIERISPLLSLREKEGESNTNENQTKEKRRDKQNRESRLQSLNSEQEIENSS
ncbi:unnamed protein product [Fraxinus pennsylvanica]|uniref:Uncharacterized protein n=1 Tax=Fraxinus pennsylvanica TaxID=56036 RepID=A0AAD1ZEM1_9LAMI|nr:unnamed protein product [Fraxinus pennsylvanica]